MSESTDTSRIESPDGESFFERLNDVEAADTIAIVCCECEATIVTLNHPDDMPIALCRQCAVDKLVALGVA